MTSRAGPVAYEVTLEVEPGLTAAVELELRAHHIPAILATGCFAAIRLERTEAGGLRTRYEAATRADLERYLAEHTARLRSEFMARFPAGVRATREVWHGIASWQRDPA
ncbi:MAG: DUF4286 family protein [Gemmatimonadales bacterium]